MLHWGWGFGWVGAILVEVKTKRQNGLTPVKRVEIRVRCGNIPGLGRKSGMYVSKPGILRQAGARQAEASPRADGHSARARRALRRAPTVPPPPPSPSAFSSPSPRAAAGIRGRSSILPYPPPRARARAAARAGAAGRVREPWALPGLPTLTRPALGVPAPEPRSVALAGSRGPLRWLGAGVRCAGCSPAE